MKVIDRCSGKFGAERSGISRSRAKRPLWLSKARPAVVSLKFPAFFLAAILFIAVPGCQDTPENGNGEVAEAAPVGVCCGEEPYDCTVTTEEACAS